MATSYTAFPKLLTVHYFDGVFCHWVFCHFEVATHSYVAGGSSRWGHGSLFGRFRIGIEVREY